MVQKMFMGSLLLICIVGCFCDDQKAVNQLPTDKNVEKAVWNAKLLTAEYEKLAVLTEGDELHFHHNSTKEALSFFMSLIYSANDAVTLTKEVDFDHIPDEHHAKNALIVSIGKLHNAVTELIEEVHNETLVVKHGESDFALGENVISLVEEIFSAYTSFVLEKNETSEQVLREGCSKLTQNDTLAQLHSEAQEFAAKHLQVEHYSDEAFDVLDSYFSKIIAQIALFYPQCYYMENGTNIDHETVEPVRSFVKNVVETFAEINLNRETDYWNETSVTGILEKHLSNNKDDFRTIAKNIGKEFEEKYVSINEKHDYRYSVIVYKDVNGFNKHSVSGNEYRFKFHFNGKNVVILRGHALNKPYCEALETIDYKFLSGCSKDLSVTSDKVIERCSNINNALFITLDASPETYPDDKGNQLLGYKEASMKGCVLMKNRALFYTYN